MCLLGTLVLRRATLSFIVPLGKKRSVYTVLAEIIKFLADVTDLLKELELKLFFFLTTPC